MVTRHGSSDSHPTVRAGFTVPQGAVLVRSAEGSRAPYVGVTSQDELDGVLAVATARLRRVAVGTAR